MSGETQNDQETGYKDVSEYNANSYLEVRMTDSDLTRSLSQLLVAAVFRGTTEDHEELYEVAEGAGELLLSRRNANLVLQARFLQHFYNDGYLQYVQ